MNIKTLLVEKFLKERGERFPIISVFGVLGVLLGVFAIIVVISVMHGFEKELVTRLIDTQPHLYITDAKTPVLFKRWNVVLNKISSDKEIEQDIVAASAFVESETIMYFNDVTIGAVVFGVSDDFFHKLSVPVPEHREIVLGEQLGLSNQIIRNDKVELLSAWDIVTSISAVPKLRKFTVRDFIRTGSYARDLKYIYVNINDAVRYFTPMKSFPTGLVLFYNDPINIDRMESKLRKLLAGYPDLKIETWKDRNKRIFYSLKLERIAMLITLFFIVIVASFSIIVSLVLMVESKKKDFTILLSMGLRRKNLRRVLLMIALIKGTIGAVIGGILGTVFCFLLDKYEFISLPTIYYDTHLPVDYSILFSVVVVVFAILICLVGALYPLRVMSKFSVNSQLRKG